MTQIAQTTRLLVATTNPGKLREITPLLSGLPIELVTLADLPPIPEPEESAATFWENARIKALAYARASRLTTVAEDSGLEIDALGGEPGVHSARFLGASTPYPARFEAIFHRLRSERREARFVTALAMARGDDLLFETETVIDGTIANAPSGTHGFGYDPIFFYPPLGATTGELPLEAKAAISHRARAFRDLASFLRSSAGFVAAQRRS
jgi:XTP/dITP diphosphohydrolase